MGNRSRNFSDWEFRCPCGKCDGTVEDRLVDKLQELRDAWDRPITLTSGYRCEEYNDKIGGAVKSLHMEGLACDIDVEGLSGHWKHRLLSLCFHVGFTGIGIGPNWFHLDLRPANRKYLGVY